MKLFCVTFIKKNVHKNKLNPLFPARKLQIRGKNNPPLLFDLNLIVVLQALTMNIIVTKKLS